jgi:FHS family L-fucose permease-like MFS transporter
MKKNKVLLQLIPVMLGFYVMGFCDIVGLSSDYVQRSFNWSPAVTGFVPSMVFIWFLFLGIPFGNLMNRIGRKTTVMISFGVTIVGMLMPLISYNSTVCLLAFALLGIGNTILQVSLNPLLGNIVKSPKLLTSSLTVGQVVKAVSSLMGPEMVLLAIGIWGDDKWYYCFPILGLITIVSGVWLLFTPIEREKSSEGGTSIAATFALLKNNIIMLLFLGIIFVVGLDVSVNFISSKLMSARFSWGAEQVKFAPQAYFLCRTIGALLGSYLLTRIDGVRYFRANIVACVGAILVLMFVKQPMVDMACIGAIGFFASSVFSIIYSVAIQNRPEKTNEISGLMITAISGGAIVSPAIGFAIEMFGITGGVGVILICGLYLTFCSFKLKTNAELKS